MLDWTYTCIGLLILLLAGDSLVRGAVNLSLRLGVPALIVSLTVVAFGTSAPELLISVQAVRDHVPGLALGNVVGSNIANILLVLGLPAMFYGLRTSVCRSRKSYLFMLFSTLLFIAVCYLEPITWVHGMILLAALGLVLTDNFLDARAQRRRRRDGERAGAKGEEPEIDLEGVDEDMPWWQIGVFTLLGLIGLPLGADLLVEGASNIARSFGVAEAVIGLTLVAIGTSLPELATSIMAARKDHADVALGNVVGSNMFNLLAIIGIASFFGEIPVPAAVLSFDLWVMLGASLMILPLIFMHWNISRFGGFMLAALYALYIWMVFS